SGSLMSKGAESDRPIHQRSQVADERDSPTDPRFHSENHMSLSAVSHSHGPIEPGGYRALDRDMSYNDSLSNSSYQPYPTTQPFIHTDYRRSPEKPINSFPESNRAGVISALKGLQDKIRNLEAERSQAEENLKTLSSETSRFKDVLNRDQERRSVKQTDMSKQTQELGSQLSSAESRCQLLEKQLEYMRKMVQSAETDRNAAQQQTAAIETQKRVTNLAEDEQLRRQLNKIVDLEREHLKLTATQTLAESKIRELEDKLKEEKHHRKLIQEKSAELQSAAETNRILIDAVSPTLPRKLKKKKKKTISSKAYRKQECDPPSHFRLNLKEIPFVAGQSTSKSHRLGANVQNVLALMKSHNTDLCTAAGRTIPTGHSKRGSTTPSSSTEEDLNDLMLQLQDEFGQMSFEHQETMRQINETVNYRVREDLERELEQLVAKMEAKGDQINRLRRMQQEHRSIKSKKQSKQSGGRAKSATAHLHTPEGGEVKVVTTVHTKGAATGNVVVRPSSAGANARASLGLLKDMKKMQSSLRKDDISWDK
ncbi:unnamed protein product, partial [Owenia fusiformis]